MSNWNDFKVEKENNNKVLTVPMQRANRGSPKLEFPKPNKWGGGLKIAIRQVAKKTSTTESAVVVAFIVNPFG